MLAPDEELYITSFNIKSCGKCEIIKIIIIDGKIDILGISETHLHADIRTEEVSIDGYTYIRKDRNHGPS